MQKEHIKQSRTNSNLYINTTFNEIFQNITSVLILFVKYSSLSLSVCVWVTNTNTTKKDYSTKVSYVCWLSISTGCFFLWFDEISVFEAGKSLTERVEQGREWLQRVYIFMAVDCWKSNVKKGKSVLILLVEMERVRVFSLEVTMEREWVLEGESIYKQSLSCSRLQKRGTKLKLRT